MSSYNQTPKTNNYDDNGIPQWYEVFVDASGRPDAQAFARLTLTRSRIIAQGVNLDVLPSASEPQSGSGMNTNATQNEVDWRDIITY